MSKETVFVSTKDHLRCIDLNAANTAGTPRFCVTSRTSIGQDSWNAEEYSPYHSADVNAAGPQAKPNVSRVSKGRVIVAVT
jgi:hypothetical protein